MGNIFDAEDYVPMEINQMNDIYVYHRTNHTDKIAGVIVNITSGTSYDPLFTKVPQRSESGSRVLVYHANYQNLNQILNQLKGVKSKKPIIGRLLNQIKQIDPDCAIFNWQCCSACQKLEFPRGIHQNMTNLKAILNLGYMTMFSDFSLKALIRSWDQQLFGPNPFIYISEFGGNFRIGFDKSRISECPSSQLKTVGQLSKESNCQLKALQKTIVYTLNYQKIKNQKFYIVQLLTVALVQNIQQKYKCKINQYSGSAGHVLIRFSSGGSLLASMGHWCQLVKVKTSQAELLQVVKKNYGQRYLEQNYTNKVTYLSRDEKQNFLQSFAINMVQQSTPGNHQFRKLKKSNF